MHTVRPQELYSIYRKMFSRFGPQGWWPGRTKTEIIIGAILTQNTNWQNVEKALANLRKAGLLNFKKLHGMDEAVIAHYIRPAGYFNVKARRLKNFVRFFIDGMNSDWRALRNLPVTKAREKVLTVNGVGPETADSILLYAFDRPTFVVDAYTKRIFHRYGLIENGASYDQVRSLFMERLREDVRLYNEYHALIVRLAKEYCRTRPVCAGCPLKDACRTGLRNLSAGPNG